MDSDPSARFPALKRRYLKLASARAAFPQRAARTARSCRRSARATLRVPFYAPAEGALRAAPSVAMSPA